MMKYADMMTLVFQNTSLIHADNNSLQEVPASLVDWSHRYNTECYNIYHTYPNLTKKPRKVKILLKENSKNKKIVDQPKI
jgi:hypothetical protein